MGGPSRLSRLDMGLVLASVLGCAEPQMVGVTLSAAGLDKTRPADLSMNSSKLTDIAEWRPLSFEEGLKATFLS